VTGLLVSNTITAEVGLFGPLLFGCHTPVSIFTNEHRFGRIEAGWIKEKPGDCNEAVYKYSNPIHFTLKFPNVNFQPKLNIRMPGPLI
jgi:hypothetical protein